MNRLTVVTATFCRAVASLIATSPGAAIFVLQTVAQTIERMERQDQARTRRVAAADERRAAAVLADARGKKA